MLFLLQTVYALRVIRRYVYISIQFILLYNVQQGTSFTSWIKSTHLDVKRIYL